GAGTRLTRAVSDSSHTNGVLVRAAGALVEGVKVRWTQGYAFEVHGPDNRLVGDTAIAPCMIGVYLEARESSAARNVELRGVHVEGAATLPGCASFNRQSVAGIQAYGFATVSPASTPPRVTGGTGDPFAGSIAVFQGLYPTAAAQDALLGNVNGDTVDLQETLIGRVAVARPEVPWRVSRTVTVSGAGASLQALPGASLAMGNGASLVFQDGGRIVARGTPLRPVLFTAARTDQPWRGIELRGAPSENSYLVNAVLERGSSTALADPAAVVTYDAHRVTIDSSLFRLMAGDGRRGVLAWAPGSSVSHTTFSAVQTGLDLAAPTVVDSNTFDGGSFGVFVSGANVVLRGNVFTRNASDAIHFNTNVPHNPTIAGNRFEQNGGLGVNTETGEAIDARLNYWGDDAGPLGPNGDGVAAGVLYDPWLKADGSAGQPPVTSVVVTPTPADVEVGRTVQLTAATTPGGRPVAWSTIDAAVATVDAGGLVTGVAPGTARIIASAESVADTATVNVVAAATVTWLGGAAAAPTAWETAANWRPARVPTPGDTARIGPTANVPRLEGPATIGGLAFAPGGALAFQGSTLTVTGDVDVRGTLDAGGPGAVRMTGAGRTLAGTLWAGLEVAGDVSLADATRVTGSVDLSGAGRLRVNGRTLEIDGTLDVDGGAAGAALVMTNPQDSVVISGLYASFAGASTETLLTAGTLVIAGRLQQADDGVARGSFAAGPAHRTVLVGTAADTRQLVQFQSPGPSHFGQLLTRNAVNEVLFQTDAHVAGAASLGNSVRLPSNVLVKVASDLQLAAGAQVSNEGRLQFCGSYNGNDAATVGPNEPISCGQPYRVAVAPDSVDVAVGGSTTLTPTVFNAADSVLAATPLWRSLDTDIATVSPAGVVSGVANGVTLVIAELGFGADTTKVVVGTGVRVTNIAEWVGGAAAAPNDWQTAANWRPAQVPLATDTVVVRAGTGFVPTLSAATQIGGLRVESSAAVDLGGNALVVTGSVETGDEGGVVGESAEGVLALAGSGTIRGRFSQIQVAGAYTMSGDVGVSLNTILTAPLTLNGRTLNVGGGLGVAGNGALVMQNPADQVNVTGFASFQGEGNEGLMTAGTLTLYGDFSASNGSAFIAGPQHRTQFQGTQAQSIAFLSQSPGPSHFGTLVTQGAGVSFLTNAQAAGPIDLGGRVTIPDTMLVKGAGDLVIAGIVNNFGRLQYCGTLSSRGESGIGPNPAIHCATPYRIAVVPESLTVAVDATARITATLRNAADSVLSSGQPTFVSTDPTTATVDAGGNVTGAQDGIAFVNVSLGGFEFSVKVTVGTGVPPVQNTLTWNGTSSAAWEDAANWTPKRVPTEADSVYVPAGTPMSPVVGQPQALRALVLEPEAHLDLGSASMTVGAELVVGAGAAVTYGGDSFAFEMPGGGTRYRGTVPSLRVSGDVTLTGESWVQGALRVAGAGSAVRVAGNWLSVSGDLNVDAGSAGL
ncbi:MAG: Ig-like domain-containing protein, partial [Gemmatimonadaceae bacterium]